MVYEWVIYLNGGIAGGSSGSGGGTEKHRNQS